MPKLDRYRVVPRGNLPQHPQMRRITEVERKAIRRCAIECVESALRLCDEAGDSAPACHLQLGLDMLAALERGDQGVLPPLGIDSDGIDSKAR